MVSECNTSMALYSPLNSVTPIKARLKRITLQRKVDAEEDLLYDLLFHMCVTVPVLKLWQANRDSGIGPLLRFH